MSKRRRKSPDGKRTAQGPADAVKEVPAPAATVTTSPSRPPRSAIPSALIWFAVGVLLTLTLAHPTSWPGRQPLPVATAIDWPDSAKAFPEFRATQTLLLSTAAIFFLLVPLAVWSLPRRVLWQTMPESAAGRFGLERAGYWLMWPAVALFAACFFVPGTGVPLAWPAYPAGAVFWRAAAGHAAVVWWLLAVLTVWLATVISSSAHAGRILTVATARESVLLPCPALGVLAGAGMPLVVYPLLTAWGCGWMIDLVSGSETFVPTGTVWGASPASTGGGEPLLWQSLFDRAAWPTLILCIVPVVGLAAGLLPRRRPGETDAARKTNADTPSVATEEAESTVRTGSGKTSWTRRALLLAATSFCAGILLLAMSVRYASAEGLPRRGVMGVDWRIAWVVVGLMALSSFSLRKGLWGKVSHAIRRKPAKSDSRDRLTDPVADGSGPRVAAVWLAAAVLLAVLAGGTAAWQLSCVAGRGWTPATARHMLYPSADLQYASALRRRVLDLTTRLESTRADQGVLTAREQILLELGERLQDRLIAPTEKTAVEMDNPAVLAGLAFVAAGRIDAPTGAIAFQGSPDELTALISDIRTHANVLKLPTVVAGGRAWVGVTYLLTVILLGYLILLGAALVVVLAVRRGEARTNGLRGLAPFWHLGTVLAVFWLAAG